MDNLFKHLGAALLGTTIAASSFAGTFSPACNCDIGLLTSDGGFTFGITGIWSRASFKDIGYAIVDADPLATVPRGRERSVDPSRDWNWGIDVGYRFADTARDVRLAYNSNEFDDSERAAQGTGTLWPTALSNAGNTPLLPETARAKVDVDFDSVDLEFAKTLYIGTMLNLRLHAGGRWAEVDRGATINYNGIDFSTVKINSDYWGIGPRFGADLQVPIGDNGFSIVGRISSAMLIGEIKDKILEDRTANNVNQVIGTSHSDTWRIVPAVDASLAVAYQWDRWGFSIGYQAVNYFNVVDRTKFIGDVTDLPSVTHCDTSDAGYHGVFIRAGVII